MVHLCTPVDRGDCEPCEVELANSAEQGIPQVGMGVTFGPWSDCYPGTVIRVSDSAKTAEIQEDKATLVSGSIMDGSAQYTYERDPEGRTIRIRKNRVGKWVSTPPCYWVHLGGRRFYRDPHF